MCSKVQHSPLPYDHLQGSSWMSSQPREPHVLYLLNMCKISSSVAQEPGASSPLSQQPTTGPYCEPVRSNPQTQANLPKIHSDTILPPTPWSSEWCRSFRLSHQNLLQLFSPLPCVPHALSTSFIHGTT
jgi:hypothetical protein